MNKKGFSLMELLVVITLIAVIGTSSYIILVKSMKTGSENKYNNIVYQIKDAADVYVSLNNDLYDIVLQNGEVQVTLLTLKNHGYINNSLINPLTNEQFSNDCYIRVYKINEKVQYDFMCP